MQPLKILLSLTLDEKISLLTGVGSMSTVAIPRLGLKAKQFADGPHGVRSHTDVDCTAFPCLSLVGSTWDTKLVYKMGVHLAKDCIKHGVDMLLGPGTNIKRSILCGRNFEYISEDPVLAGEIAAAYINGLQSLGVAASLKHYAANNQEKYRTTINVDADIRTLMEIYLKAFEIAVKKSSPASVMCAYNKIHSVWCSENKFILTDVLREMWGFDGFVVSDWGAVHNPVKSLKAGLDMQMPQDETINEKIKKGLDGGEISIEELDTAVGRMIEFMLKRPQKISSFDREDQHKVAREVAASGVVLLKNDENVLPITKEKYRKIAIIGEFANSPLVQGQGSAEVKVDKMYIDSPVEELKKILGNDIEFKCLELYGKNSFVNAAWRERFRLMDFISDVDLVLFFMGSMESEDTEFFDRRSAELHPNFELFVDYAAQMNKKTAVIIQSGSAMILGDCRNKAQAIVQMWLGGEAAGGAIADVLSGRINPSGKLSETFPVKLRNDLEYPGNERYIEYKEKLFVGYRYYDIHPEEIAFPFGHGLSYTKFEYSNAKLVRKGDEFEISFLLKNTGKIKGSEVVQLYVGNPDSTVVRPIKELKAFDKVELESEETKIVNLTVSKKNLGYFNILLKDFITEPGKYVFYIGSSSRDIRLTEEIIINDDIEYTVEKLGDSMVG